VLEIIEKNLSTGKRKELHQNTTNKDMYTFIELIKMIFIQVYTF